MPTDFACRWVLFFGLLCGPILPQLFILEDTPDSLQVLTPVETISADQIAFGHKEDVISGYLPACVEDFRVEPIRKRFRSSDKHWSH